GMATDQPMASHSSVSIASENRTRFQADSARAEPAIEGEEEDFTRGQPAIICYSITYQIQKSL
ncbi:hypothetical protein, partial [Pseudomonas coronafaciens]|uniref:hypothetical protein n=1 Tax=Pseudomonas coronafaciens TaxID=53409 RepID=UPI001C826A0C